MEETITRTAEACHRQRGTADDPFTQRKARKAAIRYLESIGCDILESNWECSAGTVDVICDDDGTLAFVAVVAGYGHLPDEDVTHRNQRRFEEFALSYLAEHGDLEGFARFDIISIGIVEEHRALLRHHRGAFN